MGIISPAPRSAMEFRPYAGSQRFLQLYAKKHESRPVNEFSRRDTTPLILGGREDLDPLKISLMDKNLLFQIQGKPAYLFKSHGFGAYACAEAVEFGILSKGATLFRFDAHPDLSHGFEPKETLEDIYQASQSPFSEHSYVSILARLGYISNICWFRSSAGPRFINGDEKEFQAAFPAVKLTSFYEHEIANFNAGASQLPANKSIFDIDYDYFGNLQHEYMFTVTNLIRNIFRQSGLLLQALSPECIDPRFASRLAVDLMTNL